MDESDFYVSDASLISGLEYKYFIHVTSVELVSLKEITSRNSSTENLFFRHINTTARCARRNSTSFYTRCKQVTVMCDA